MRIAVCTAIWKRHYLFGLFAKHMLEMQVFFPDVEFINVAAGSELNRSKMLAESHGFKYVETPNSPLSNKWNKCVELAATFDPNYFLLLGSDDFFDKKFLEKYIHEMQAGVEYIGITDCYFYDSATEKIMYWGGYTNGRKGESIGLGRAISKGLYERFGDKLWDDGLNRSLDLSLTRRLNKIIAINKSIFKLIDIEALAVDVKTNINISKLGSYTDLKQIKLDKLKVIPQVYDNRKKIRNA